MVRRGRNTFRNAVLLVAGGMVAMALVAGYGSHPWWRVGPMVHSEPILLVRDHHHWSAHHHHLFLHDVDGIDLDMPFIEDLDEPSHATSAPDWDILVPGGNSGYLVLPFSSVAVNVHADP